MNALFYKVDTTANANYMHVSIEVFEADTDAEPKKENGYPVVALPTGPDALFTFTWQADNETPDWYAFSTELRTSDPARLVHAAKTAARILETLEGWRIQPGQVLDRFAEKRIKEVVYDPRLSAHIYPADVPAPELKRFLDDSPDGCTVSVLAPDECAARPAILLEWTGYINRTYDKASQTRRLTQWLENKQPVRVDCWGNAPDTRPAAVRISQYKPAYHAAETTN